MLLHLTALAARGVSARRQSPMLSAVLRYAEPPSPIRQARCRTGDEGRAGDQFKDRKADRRDDSAQSAGESG
jgi:hypothetical protein